MLIENAAAPDGRCEGGRVRQAGSENERMAELESTFIGLLANFEHLADRYAEVCRRLGTLELQHVVEQQVAP